MDMQGQRWPVLGSTFLRGLAKERLELTFMRSRSAQGYVVLNRPWAFVQWIQKAEFEEE